MLVLLGSAAVVEQALVVVGQGLEVHLLLALLALRGVQRSGVVLDGRLLVQVVVKELGTTDVARGQRAQLMRGPVDHTGRGQE